VQKAKELGVRVPVRRERSRTVNEPAATVTLESFLAGDVVASSRGRNWHGIEVMTAHIARTELDISGLRTHTLAINTGLPFIVDARIDGRSCSAPIAASGMMLIEAGVHSEWRWENSALDMLHLSLDDDALAAHAGELGLPMRPELRTTVGFTDPVLLCIGNAFAAELARPAGGALVADALRVAFIVALVERYSSAPGHPSLRRPARSLGLRTLRRLDDYMSDHLAADIGLDDLARLTGLSRFHFARAFRASVGVSPYRYLLERRLQRARSLLSNTRTVLSAVAGATGFADQSHLTRAIKRRYGVTPAVLRRNEQDSSRP
jgi:AraC family transcriptional regulator